jgi:hypothetical protein
MLMIDIVLSLPQAIMHPREKAVISPYLAGFRIEGHLAFGACGLFLDLIGKQLHFRLAGRTGDLDCIQRLVAFKTWTMLICHDKTPSSDCSFSAWSLSNPVLSSRYCTGTVSSGTRAVFFPCRRLSLSIK